MRDLKRPRPVPPFSSPGAPRRARRRVREARAHAQPPSAAHADPSTCTVSTSPSSAVSSIAPRRARTSPWWRCSGLGHTTAVHRHRHAPLNTYEQTFWSTNANTRRTQHHRVSDVREIAAATRPPRGARRPSRSRDDPPFAREGVARGGRTRSDGSVRRVSRVTTSTARRGRRRSHPRGNVAWFVCDACDETSSGIARQRRRRTSRRRTSGTTDAGTRSVGQEWKRKKRSRDDVRSRRPAAIVGDVTRRVRPAAAAAAAAADGRRTFDPRLAGRRRVRRGRCRATTTGAKPGLWTRFGDGRIRGRPARGAGEDGEDAVMVPAPGWLPWSVADVLHGERDGSPRRAFVPLVRNASLTPRPWGVDVPRSDSQCSLDVFGILLDADASASSPLGPAA